jgi:peptide/nickel transport system permease protein
MKTNLRLFFRNSMAVLGLVLILGMSLAGVFAPRLAPYDPEELHPRDRLSAPNSQYWLGTDEYGRDILSRLLYGARASLSIVLIAQSIATILGVLLGLLAGWYGGWIDTLIMRLADALLTIPLLMFLIVWVTVLDSSRESVFVGLGLMAWQVQARLIRSQVLSFREHLSILAARAIGASDFRILFVHILPNAIAPSITLAALGMGNMILLEASLSFLGLGTSLSEPSWGQMIEIGWRYTTSAWWYALFPGLAIMTVVLGFNFLGDGIQDALLKRK